MKMIFAALLAGIIALSPGLFPVMAEEAEENELSGHATNLEKRIENLEKADELREEKYLWLNRLDFSGLVEVEAGYSKTNFDDPEEKDEKTSDVDLATVELAVDVAVVEHLEGHVMVKYEEDEVFVDEGFIMLTGSEAFPVYLRVGRQYLPFGRFESCFVTDPNTLLLGETNDGALVAGVRMYNGNLDLALGGFNGRIHKAGKDDTLNGFIAGISAHPMEAISLGASYTSNLASSDAFSESVTDRDEDGEMDPVADLVGGWTAFVTLNPIERLSLMGEYVGALDKFQAGEIYDPEDGVNRKPCAWNLELGVTLTEGLELAARYGGSDDGGDFLPESQYGTVLNWGLFEDALFAIEYLHGQFENDTHETDSFTAQLAIEF